MGVGVRLWDGHKREGDAGKGLAAAAKDLKDSTAIFKRLALTRRLRDDGIARE
jgi:hypothetical protein